MILDVPQIIRKGREEATSIMYTTNLFRVPTKQIPNALTSQEFIRQFDPREPTQKMRVRFIIFVICFLLVLCLFFNSTPYFWAKSSLSTSVQPKNVQRGQNVFFSGALVGDDVAGKTVTLSITDTD